MNQFIRLAQAPAIAVVFASVWFSGCATPESGGRATVLSLPYGQFDQTFGSGWRPLFDFREYGKAAALMVAAQYPQIRYIDRLCDTFGSSYAEMYWWARLCPAVTFPQDASPPHRAAAEQLAKAFGFSATGVTTYPQPSCIWVELRDFAPESAAMGYVIIHSPDGTHITASSQ